MSKIETVKMLADLQRQGIMIHLTNEGWDVVIKALSEEVVAGDENVV